MRFQRPSQPLQQGQLGESSRIIVDQSALMMTYREYVMILADPGTKDEIKLKAAQELSEHFEVIIAQPQYPAFLDHAIKIFLKILQDGEVHFIGEYSIQQVRKLILEMIHRLPTNDCLCPYVKSILALMMKLLGTENEENVLVCLRIIIELHKQYRPQFNAEIQHFLSFVKNIYRDLPNHMHKIFEPRPSMKVNDIADINIEALLSETFTVTVIQTEKKTPKDAVLSYNLIPKATMSLKVLQELPIIVVLMFQLYKQNVHQDVADFIPLIMTTITLQPTVAQRTNPNFNKEVYVDFMGAQIKTLSFLAFIIRLYQEVVAQHATHMVKGMLGLLTLCPQEVAHLRKELLIAARHILSTELRLKFVPYMDRLFDENVLLGKGWTTHESLRPLAYSTLADLVHHVRQHLQLTDLAKAVHLFSMNVHDESLPTNIQTMSCKLLLNLVDCIRQRSEMENGNGRELLLRMLEVFVLKFKTISKIQLPVLLSRCKQTLASSTSSISSPTPTTNTNAGVSSLLKVATTSASTTSPSSNPNPPFTPLMSSTPPSSSSALFNSSAAGQQPGISSPADTSLGSVSLPGTPDRNRLIPSISTTLMDSPQVGSSSAQEKSRFGFPASQTCNYSVTDCRSMVKTLVCGVKTITWGCAACKTSIAEAHTQSKVFQPKEVRVFIRLVKWAMQALDIYSLSVNPLLPGIIMPTVQRSSSNQTVRSKEEKEVLEHFAGVFIMMNSQNFQEIFSSSIDYMVDRINRNCALQVLANSFLANPTASPVFATVLLEYLLERMEEMGNSVEKSNLYLKLFKLVFGSVSLFPAENEHMLRPHLHKIVNRSMELAMIAKEPYNYFLLLRALFRSIGGGSHDLLYQEFLPLLPNLLQGLNSLQGGLHKQHMKDLFVELCLTVPVRLSSLLPYLPMLMDPLVSALNGSHTLISQGLRTLELCVDNLQPDFLYEHIQPVRADLMQALWRTLRNPSDQVAHVAFRVLGKFGGGNRKMMIEPQRLNYDVRQYEGPCLTVFFTDHTTPIKFPVQKVIQTAFIALKTNTTESYYRKECWEVIRCYLIASQNLSDSKEEIFQLFSHPSFVDPGSKIAPTQGVAYKYADTESRQTHETALTAMFVAAAIKELRQCVIPTMVYIVTHYTMLAISQQTGPFHTGSRHGLCGMDASVLIDSLAVIMGHEEKELCKPGHVALALLLDTATLILGSEERACRLPIMECLAERMCSLCYDRAWYTKLGGCIAIKFMFERMSLRWVFEHLFVFLKSLLFVMMDLTGEVSSGAIDMAKTDLEKLLSICAAPIVRDGKNDDVANAQIKSLFEVTHELVRQVTSPNTLVRQQAMHSLEVLAKIQNKSVTEVMEPHKEILQDMIPPKKHLLRHQPANAQIGIMDGNTFCTTLEPRLFTIDLGIVEHKVFFHEVMSLCEAEDSTLNKLPCYKSVPSLIPLRKSAYRALAACHYIETCREKIFNVLYRALERSNPEIQEAGLECMKKFISGFQIDKEMVHSVIRPLLLTLGDYRNLTLNGTKRLAYLTVLFPPTFNVKLLEQMLQHLKKLLELTIVSQKGCVKYGENERKIETIINIFHNLPAHSGKFLDTVCRYILQAEKSLLVETSSPFRQALMNYLLRFPQDTVDLFLCDLNIKDQQWNRYLEYIIRHEKGKPIRDVLQRSVGKLTALALAHHQNLAGTAADRSEMQYMSIRITSLLIRFDDQWLSSQHMLVKAYKTIWCEDSYLEPHKRLDGVEYTHWKEPKLLVRVLLHYFCHHPNDIDLLFQLLRVLCNRYIPDFQFLRDFLENTVSQNYTVDWKRAAFFRFVDMFQSSVLSQDLKAKILQLILIPCFAVSFERGEGEKLIGGPAMPEQENPENCVSVFISQVIDPENPFSNSDSVRIFNLQFSCLLMEQASPHIHDAANKRQGAKVRRLLMFAWPCLLGKICVDPATRYHGHLLLSHIIAKFAIHKRLKLQVFHSLLKAHAIEARSVVRQALEILTPLIPVRMEDGYTMLTHWTKKIIVEEGHSMPQLVHMLQLVVRHYKVYYPVRHHLVQYMVSSMQRLGFSPTATIEHRKLAVELAEVIIKWDLQRIKDEADANEGLLAAACNSLKRPHVDEPGPSMESNKKRHAIGPGPCLVPAVVPKVEPDNSTPIERVHCDSVLNFLLRLACQVNDHSTTLGSPGELLSRRCVALLKTALKVDVWPYAGDLKLNWLDKVFISADTSSPNFGNICTALELLTYLLGIMKKEQILTSMKPLQRGLAVCISSSNSKVIRLVHALMTRLMSTFPTESTTASVASKYEELETLYSSLGKFVLDGLAAYEKNNNATPTTLFGPLMMLKSACLNNQTYIDRLITPFMRVLLRMTREHLNPSVVEQPSSTGVDLLILSLDLVKNRVVVMGIDMRKTFIGNILVGLIEKTPEIKIMKAIAKMLEDWMKNKNPIAINQTPTLREKSILLGKMMHHVEKRFTDDLELNAQYLDIINFVYRDESLKHSELSTKLEPAFMQGLRCTQPLIRAKFFEVLDCSVKRRLHDRLLYMMVSQNWEPMGPHYWIRQCIELIIMAVNPEDTIKLFGRGLVPPITKSLKEAGAAERAQFVLACKKELNDCREDPMDTSDDLDSQEKEDDLDLVEIQIRSRGGEELKKNRKASLRHMITRHSNYMDSIRNTYSLEFLMAAAQLCHMDTKLAESVWLHFYPALWKLLDSKQHDAILGELVPFLSSGAHVVQKDCQPSSLNTFVEGLTLCGEPEISLKPTLMKYLGKSHNLWHRMTLILEQLALDPGPSSPTKKAGIADCYEFEPSSPLQKCEEVLDCLADMYTNLHEEDMWSGLWQKHARYKETNIAIAFETQGFFEQAQATYELLMGKTRNDNEIIFSPVGLGEGQLWERQWIRCSKELNQWDLLLVYGSEKSTSNPFLVLESSWRVPNWIQMHEALAQIEHSCPKYLSWKVNLYRGYLAICSTGDQHLTMVDRYVEIASGLCMREWRRLPAIVSHIHLPILQAAQQIMELQEAAQITQSLLHNRNSSIHDMKAIVKTWRNRLPVIADDLSHWSDIFAWRQHHYTSIASHYDSQHEQGANHSMLGVHASAQAIIHFGKIARKHGLSGVCLDSLSRIYTIPSVPVVDCFQKIRQQVKCYLHMASISGGGELQEGLEVIESTNLKYFTKEMTSEFYAYKGMLLAQLGRTDEASKAFSTAVQMQDQLVRSWGMWGDFLEKLFTRDPTNIALGQSAITAFLHACRLQNESKSRKHLAKVLWLLTYDDEQSTLTDAVDKYQVGIPPLHWLPWIPQLLTCLVRNEGKLILNLLSQVGRMFPQAVYFPIRTLYLTLKIEQRERYKSAEIAASINKQGTSGTADASGTPATSSGDLGPIRATPPMWRCSRIMHMQRDTHPTVLSSLEGIVDQMVWFRENWYEEVLRQLRQGLAKCYAMAFENRGAVSEATITPHTLNFVKKLVATFGIGIELKGERNPSSAFTNAASESLASRARATVQDPVFQLMKLQFTGDFDFNIPGALKLHNLIQKLRKWILILQAKVKSLPKSFLIEEKCRFLSNFSLHTAEVELPGEFLLPKHSHYYVRIARFMPRVDIVPKHNSAARRLYIKGHNGKTYPYLVVNDSGLGDARREERVLQLIRMLNQYLGKKKETSRRFLHFTIPRVVPVSPQMRLIEDNPSSFSLMDIYLKNVGHLNRDFDDPVTLYYDRLAGIQARGAQASIQVLREILQEVQNKTVLRTILRAWTLKTYPAASDYWTFRKMFTLQLALVCFCEYVFHLTRMNPDMLYVHQDSGLVNISYFKFDVDDTTGNLDSCRPVPFRLTPNIIELVSMIGITGPLTSSMIAAARCMVQPSFKVQTLLQAVLRDEMIASYKKKQDDCQQEPISMAPVADMETELLINMVTQNASSIMARLNSLANFDGIDSKVGTLVAAAMDPNNLCRMDPAWHPWL